MASPWIRVVGVVVSGHAVASGQANDPRFPHGTLALQIPHFESGGLDLARFYRATINVSIKPDSYAPKRPLKTFRNVKWHPDCAAEDFSFFSCRVIQDPSPPLDALIYYPHPETKPEHFQDDATLEILAPFIQGIRCGSQVVLELHPDEISIIRKA